MLRKDRVVLLLSTCMVCPSSIDNIGAVNALKFEQTPLSSADVQYDQPVSIIEIFNSNKDGGSSKED